MKNYLLIFSSRAGNQYHTVYARDEFHANALGVQIADKVVQAGGACDHPAALKAVQLKHLVNSYCQMFLLLLDILHIKR